VKIPQECKARLAGIDRHSGDRKGRPPLGTSRAPSPTQFAIYRRGWVSQPVFSQCIGAGNPSPTNKSIHCINFIKAECFSFRFNHLYTYISFFLISNSFILSSNSFILLPNSSQFPSFDACFTSS